MDQFDRLSQRATPDSFDPDSAWAGTVRRFAAEDAGNGARSGLSPARAAAVPAHSAIRPSGRHRGAKWAGALVGAAALAAAVPLLVIANQPKGQAGLASSPSPTASAESSSSAAADPTLSTRAPLPGQACAPSAGERTVTVAEAQALMQDALSALNASDLVISTETLAEDGRFSDNERITAPVAGGRLLLSQIEVGQPWPGQWHSDSESLLHVDEDGVPHSLRIRHDLRSYSEESGEDQVYGNGTDYLDPEDSGWMGQLTSHWQTAREFLLSASDPTATDGVTVLGWDQQDSCDVVKLQLAASILPAEYQADSVLTSVGLWLYLDSGLPARMAFNFDLGKVNRTWQDGAFSWYPTAGGWCWEEGRIDGASGDCTDRPIVFRWSNSSDPAADLTLEIPDGYAEWHTSDAYFWTLVGFSVYGPDETQIDRQLEDGSFLVEDWTRDSVTITEHSADGTTVGEPYTLTVGEALEQLRSGGSWADAVYASNKPAAVSEPVE
ncbi:MAG: hypothetical protein LBK95_01155 [Bifidobacteriaceae bacterium]|jgi:hypothetical protein|nr:hypothetical protein [Bifidobacteriaceae bacterium]